MDQSQLVVRRAPTNARVTIPTYSVHFFLSNRANFIEFAQIEKIVRIIFRRKIWCSEPFGSHKSPGAIRVVPQARLGVFLQYVFFLGPVSQGWGRKQKSPEPSREELDSILAAPKHRHRQPANHRAACGRGQEGFKVVPNKKTEIPDTSKSLNLVTQQHTQQGVVCTISCSRSAPPAYCC